MKKFVFAIALSFLTGSLAMGQEQAAAPQPSGQEQPTAPPTSTGGQQVYLGPGLGLDYGGFIGVKLEYLPVKYVGIFGGVGYTLVSAGYNVGATVKTTPDKKVSFNPMVMYGYNGAIKVAGASQYDAISYGVTVGANLDIKLGSRGNKLSFALFVPIRSRSFMDKYDAVKNNSSIDMKTPLLPVAIGAGFNFKL